MRRPSAILLIVAPITLTAFIALAAPPPRPLPQEPAQPPSVDLNTHQSGASARTIRDVASAHAPAIGGRSVDPAKLAAPHHPTRILVRFRPGTSAATMRAAHDRTKGRHALKDYACVPRLELVSVPPGGVAAALADYLRRADVLYAEPDYEVHALVTPNDPGFSLLWGLANDGQVIDGVTGIAGADIDARRAWDAWTGDPDFRVAVIDTGIDYTHPDLAANIWVNPGEIPGNLIDDDHNGFVDDVHGYDFINNDGDPMDDNGHGTHVSGTIGAVGDNGLGVAGVNWSCKLVALKFLGSTGSGSVSGAIGAIDYIIDQNIKVSNNSWGSSGFSQALFDAVGASQVVDHLFVAAAGNDNADIEEFPHFPSGFDLPNVISVAATDNRDARAVFSNFGPVSVDLGAPGVDTWSTLPGGSFGFLSGTSMATPHVTGVVALLRGRTPSMRGSEAKARILDGARPIAALTGITVTGGVLDAFTALDDCNHNGVSDLADIAAGTSEDCTGNGLPDECEPDCNGNFVADSCDVATGFSDDCTSNGLPDECEPDCDGDGLADVCVLAGGLDTDCNQNTVPDACEPDCNGNGVADECDIDAGFSADCTGNGIPDECEPDCNGDGLADSCAIDAGVNQDCNDNGVPDDCDLAFGGSVDCNNNGIPDECDMDCNGNGVPDDCDLATGTSEDCTGNGVPDECELDCDASGVADSCEIAAGLLPDVDGNGVADDCVLGFFLVPVGATGPHAINGNEISLSEGGQRVVLEVHFFGWDPTLSGSPLLMAYNVTLDPVSFTNGIGAPLALARIPCTIDADCPDGFFSPGVCMDGFCDDQSAFLIDESHPLYVFSGLDTITATFPNPGGLTGAGALVIDPADSVRDSVVPRYGVTISVDVPVDAEGRYAVALLEGDPFTFWLAPSSAEIPAPAFGPAVIVLPQDCNNNGVEDAQDIADGTSLDCNGNGIPDECVAVEVDCNVNGVPDDCDIADGTSNDANGNGIPDECEPGRLFVDASANGAGTGTSWADAFLELGDALATAEAADGAVQQIWVAAGTYAPTRQAVFGDDRSKTFKMVAGVSVYGGFAGGETDLSQRDIVANETILTGDLNGDDGPFGIGNAENSHHVVLADGLDVTAALDGFTITAGHADGNAFFHHDTGAGLLVLTSDVTVSNCRFIENVAKLAGSLGVINGTAAVSKCLFLQNRSFVGAGLYLSGAVTAVTVDASRFLGNSNADSGTAMVCNGASGTFRNCLFSGNASTGGFGSNAAAINTCSLTETTIINCTIVNNTATEWPAGAMLGASNATLINSILWGNRSGSGVTLEKDQVVMASPTAPVTRVIDHNGIEGWTGDLGGVGNTGGDPMFADEDGADNAVGTLDDDLRLLAASACIDIGDSSALPAGIDVDLDGNPRVVGAAIDAGAFENQMPPDCSAVNDCSSHGTCIADNVCQCDVGFSGADCSLFFCNNVNDCSGHGQCVGPDLCDCDPGFVGVDCSVAIPIPAMSTWGLVILSLLTVAAATVVLRRGESPADA